MNIENPMIRMQEEIDARNVAYTEWIERNADDLINQYAQEVLDNEVADSSYDEIIGYALDDDFEVIQNRWLDSLTINDIPNEWLSDKHENYLMNGDENE